MCQRCPHFLNPQFLRVLVSYAVFRRQPVPHRSDIRDHVSGGSFYRRLLRFPAVILRPLAPPLFDLFPQCHLLATTVVDFLPAAANPSVALGLPGFCSSARRNAFSARAHSRASSAACPIASQAGRGYAGGSL